MGGGGDRTTAEGGGSRPGHVSRARLFEEGSVLAQQLQAQQQQQAAAATTDPRGAGAAGAPAAAAAAAEPEEPAQITWTELWDARCECAAVQQQQLAASKVLQAAETPPCPHSTPHNAGRWRALSARSCRRRMPSEGGGPNGISMRPSRACFPSPLPLTLLLAAVHRSKAMQLPWPASAAGSKRQHSKLLHYSGLMARFMQRTSEAQQQQQQGADAAGGTRAALTIAQPGDLFDPPAKRLRAQQHQKEHGVTGPPPAAAGRGRAAAASQWVCCNSLAPPPPVPGLHM